jgi:prepilin-type N-terminal cleavage/methylation domain-containing protein
MVLIGGIKTVADHPYDTHSQRLQDRGFTIIELLIIIAIIGVLAIIAIPQFITYRSRAIDAQLKSDLRNAAVAVEGYFTKKSVYPSSIADIQTFGFQATDGVTLTLASGASSYTITAAKPGGTQPSFTFTSSDGSIN